MKLYATTTSERASKGQGGNEFIKTVFLVGDSKEQKTVLTVEMKCDRRGTAYTVQDERGVTVYIGYVPPKGNQQEGESWCRKCAMDMETDKEGNCIVCGHRL